jgi:hypothetical protein
MLRSLSLYSYRANVLLCCGLRGPLVRRVTPNGILLPVLLSVQGPPPSREAARPPLLHPGTVKDTTIRQCTV